MRKVNILKYIFLNLIVFFIEFFGLETEKKYQSRRKTPKTQEENIKMVEEKNQKENIVNKNDNAKVKGNLLEKFTSVAQVNKVYYN